MFHSEKQEEETKKIVLDSPIQRVLEKLQTLKTRSNFIPIIISPLPSSGTSIDDQEDLQFIYTTLATRKDIW